jgi:eukaryotic-like serine/threonine-protein kinase
VRVSPLNLPRSNNLIRFGAFELDLRARELRKDGRSTALPEQSITVLEMLLDRPGELVLREDIRLRLWPNDTVVEFDHSINTAVRKLRLALGESADNPQYIETLARRGYRWIGSAEALEALPGAGLPSPPVEPDPSHLFDGNLTGKKISHYRVLEVLGGGGMGVVYKAEDLKLGRRVALKFLPDELAKDPVALQRLEREARAASALNHPNVCIIYEIADHAGRPFIVMELLEGETLREAITEQTTEHRRPTLGKQIDLCIQISDALAAAHAHGIIHRDIKPANIFVTRTGVAKILDFGVAKLSQHLIADEDRTRRPASGKVQTPERIDPLPSNDLSLTRTGLTMGTAGYMSPEQVRGDALDCRTDLFSFGLVLYEMATGRAAFGALTAPMMREAILHGEPAPARDINPEIPERLALIIRKALEKERHKRYQTAAQMRADLEPLRRKPAPKTSPLRRALFSLGAVLGLACLLLVWVWIRSETKQPEAVFQRLSFGRGIIRSARFAPDGQSVVYGAAWDGKPSQLFWTNAGSIESRALGVEAEILAISPSGEMAVLLNQRFGIISSKGTLAVMSLTGSAPRELLDNVQDADWSPDGSKLVITHYVDGGRCDLEFPPGKVLYETTGGTWLSHPRVSPRGDQIAFLEHPLADDDGGSVEMVDLAGNKKILSDTFYSIEGLAWDSDGNAVWFSGNELGPYGRRALFKVTTTGQQHLVRRESGNLTLRDASRSGRLALTRDTSRGEVFGRIDPDDKEREFGWFDNSIAYDLSPDGRMIALSVQGEAAAADTGYAVYLRRTDGSPAVRLGDGLPTQFSLDGRWVLTRTAPPSAQLLLLPTGTGQPMTLTQDSIIHNFATLLPDGKRILFVGNEPGHARRDWIQGVAGGEPLPITPEGTVGRQVSPDGKLLVAVDQGRKFWIYPTEGTGPAALAGIKSGEDAIRWSADGKSLFVASDGLSVQIHRIEVATGRRQLIFEIAPSDLAGIWNIWPVLITPDGKSYVYSDYRILSDLYLASGLQ